MNDNDNYPNDSAIEYEGYDTQDDTGQWFIGPLTNPTPYFGTSDKALESAVEMGWLTIEEAAEQVDYDTLVSDDNPSFDAYADLAHYNEINSVSEFLDEVDDMVLSHGEKIEQLNDMVRMLGVVVNDLSTKNKDLEARLVIAEGKLPRITDGARWL